MKKALFITGGTVGTGLATAHKFASEGYAVFISSRSAERAQAAAEEITAAHGVFAKGYQLDIRDEERVKAIFNDIDSTDSFVETVVLNSADLGFGKDPAADIQRVDMGIACCHFDLAAQEAGLHGHWEHRPPALSLPENTDYCISYIAEE